MIIIFLNNCVKNFFGESNLSNSHVESEIIKNKIIKIDRLLND